MKRILLLALVALGLGVSTAHAQPVPLGGLRKVTHGVSLSGDGTVASPLSVRTDCANGQIIKWDGAAWSCSADVGITNTAGANVIMKSDGTNAVASSITDDGAGTVRQSKTAGVARLVIGDDVTAVTNSQSGFGFYSDGGASISVDHKVMTGGTIGYKYGVGAQAGNNTNWFSLDPGTGATTFTGGVTTPANLTTTGTGDLVVADVATIGGSSSAHTITGRTIGTTTSFALGLQYNNNPSAGTYDPVAIQSLSAGTLDATAASRTSYGVYGQATSTRSAGANSVTNIGGFFNATSGQANFALYTFSGDNAFNANSGSSSFFANVNIGDASTDALAIQGVATHYNNSISGLAGNLTNYTSQQQGTMDATGATRYATGHSSLSAVTRSAGANSVINIAYRAEASGGQDNYSFYGQAGALYNNGTSVLVGLVTATAGGTTPADWTTTGTGDLVSADDLTVADDSAIGDDSTDLISITGTTTVRSDATSLVRGIVLDNRTIDSTGDGYGIQFGLAAGGAASVAAGTLDVTSENATFTGATADGAFSIKLALDGVLTERLAITSAGNVEIPAGGDLLIYSSGGNGLFSNNHYSFLGADLYFSTANGVNNQTIFLDSEVWIGQDGNPEGGTSVFGLTVTGNTTLNGSVLTVGNSATDQATFSNGPAGINRYEGTHYEFTDEHFDQGNRVNTGNYNEWTTIIATGTGAQGSPSQSVDYDGRFGVTAYATGTTSTGRVAETSGVTAIDFDQVITATHEETVLVGVLSTAAQEFFYNTGFIDTLSAADNTDGCYFSYDRLGTHADPGTGDATGTPGDFWQIWCASNSTRTGYKLDTTANAQDSFARVISTVAISTWYRLKVVVEGTARARFYINGTEVGRITTNIPTGASRLTGVGRLLMKSAGSTNTFMYVDQTTFKFDLSAARSP